MDKTPIPPLKKGGVFCKHDYLDSEVVKVGGGEKILNKRGGARPGAGRTKSDRVKMTFKIDPDVKELLETIENKSDYINQLVRERIK